MNYNIYLLENSFLRPYITLSVCGLKDFCPCHSSDEQLHHCLELIEIDLAIVVLVHLFYDVEPDLLFDVLTNSQCLLQFFHCYRAAIVFIEERERIPELLIIQESLLVCACLHEFLEAELATAIDIDCSKNAVALLLSQGFTIYVHHTFKQLVSLQYSVSINIKLPESLLQLLLLLVTDHIVDHEAQRRLLQFLRDIEAAHVSEGALQDVRVYWLLRRVFEPRVLHGVPRVRSFGVVDSQHLFYEGFAITANMFPQFALHGVLSDLDLVNNFAIVNSVEWWLSG